MSDPYTIITEPGQGPDDPGAWEGYDDFRTGLTFGDVRRILAVEQRRTRDFSPDYMYVSRSTVLGRWREIKQAMFHGEAQPEEVMCPECGMDTPLNEICADCGECVDCCECDITPQDDFWRENPWGGRRWRL
jgi:hypothetical protein